MAPAFDADDDDDDDDDEMEKETQPFVCQLLTHLVRFHNARTSCVRWRVTQIIGAIVNAVDDDLEIPDELFEVLEDAMTMRARDKVPKVRACAIKALQRLYDPMEDDAPSTVAVTTALRCDPSKEVRLAALSAVQVSETTLALVVECASDIEPQVRCAAYATIGEAVTIDQLSTDQRVELLVRGMKDRDQGVREATAHLLAKRWLQQKQGDPIRVLSKFAVELYEEHEDTFILAAQTLPANDEKEPGDIATKPAAALLFRARLEACAENDRGEVGPICNTISQMNLQDLDMDEDIRECFIAKKILAATKAADLSDEAAAKTIRNVQRSSAPAIIPTLATGITIPL